MFKLCKHDTRILGSYLAGLIEGDGSIYTPKIIEGQEGKKRYPTIKITFHINDLVQAEGLINLQEGGKIHNPKGKNYIEQSFQNKKDILKIINLITPYMRTPKIKALMVIRCFYGQDNSEVRIDNSSLGSNAWFTGFFDADGNLYFEFKRNLNTGVATRLKLYGRLTQVNKVYYNEADCNDLSALMNSIGDFFSATVTYTKRGKSTGYEVRTNSKASTGFLIDYFNMYPMMTYKTRQMEKFKQVYAIKINGNYTISITKKLQALKASFSNHNLSLALGSFPLGSRVLTLQGYNLQYN